MEYFEKKVDAGQLFKALSQLQGELRTAKKDASNPFFKSKYADLPAIMEVCRALLLKHGLSITQHAVGTGKDLSLISILGHISGEFIQSSCPIIMNKQDIQGLGSAITYTRRYALASMLGVVAEEEDDDGESAMGRHQRPPERVVNRPPAPPVPKTIDLVRKEVTRLLDKVEGHVVPESRDYVMKKLGVSDLKQLTEWNENSLQDALTLLSEIKNNEYKMTGEL